MSAFKTNTIDNRLLDLALTEDLGSQWCDITTDTLFAGLDYRGQAKIVSKHPEPIRICGIELLRALTAKFSEPCHIETNYHDGDVLESGEVLLTLSGNASVLLMAERTILNFLRHLCAIATLTATFVDKVKESKLKILDTRKTTPGFRHLEKYAVQCGGGVNHRMGLYDAIMIKDTHVGLLGGLDNAIEKLPAQSELGIPVIVEVHSANDLDIVLTQGANKVTRVLLDNMTPEQLKTSVRACQGRFETESSGNINLETIQAVAATGVDYASVGMLTYGAGHVDLSMKVK